MTYMKGDNNMPTVLPKENEVEQFFSRIMASEGACQRLSNVLYDHLSDDDMQTDPDPEHLVQVLLTAYTNGDISALLLELCGRSLFDLLREAYLIPKRFHGKAGKNPELLTTPEGDVIEEKKKLVTKHEFEKFRDVYKNHSCAPRSKLYLADGYDLMRVYTDGMNIKEKRVDKRRGVLILYALPDGIMLSNGPGDPAENVEIIEELKKLSEMKIPTFGICLGHQLLALAHGAMTHKLKYGHRGANQPAENTETGRVYITSQNHGYAVENDSLPEGEAKVLYVNANDGTCEGIRYLNEPAFSVQFHPEACGGPHDTDFLFDEFIELIDTNKK